MRFVAIGLLVPALITVPTATEAQRAPPGQFLPVRERLNIRDYGYASDDVAVSGPFVCGGGEEWFIKNNSKKPQSALECRHDFIPGGGSRYSFTRKFVPVTLAVGEQKSLGCRIKHPENYSQLAYSEVGTFSPDTDLSQPYKALVFVTDPPRAGRSWTIKMVYNRHAKKAIQVELDRGKRWAGGERYATVLLQPNDADFIDGDGGVRSATYKPPYEEGGTLPCSTKMDAQPFKGKLKKKNHPR